MMKMKFIIFYFSFTSIVYTSGLDKLDIPELFVMEYQSGKKIFNKPIDFTQVFFNRPTGIKMTINQTFTPNDLRLSDLVKRKEVGTFYDPTGIKDTSIFSGLFIHDLVRYCGFELIEFDDSEGALYESILGPARFTEKPDPELKSVYKAFNKYRNEKVRVFLNNKETKNKTYERLKSEVYNIRLSDIVMDHCGVLSTSILTEKIAFDALEEKTASKRIPPRETNFPSNLYTFAQVCYSYFKYSVISKILQALEKEGKSRSDSYV